MSNEREERGGLNVNDDRWTFIKSQGASGFGSNGFPIPEGFVLIRLTVCVCTKLSFAFTRLCRTSGGERGREVERKKGGKVDNKILYLSKGKGQS